jgi:hypothetical protein
LSSNIKYAEERIKRAEDSLRDTMDKVSKTNLRYWSSAYFDV